MGRGRSNRRAAAAALIAVLSFAAATTVRAQASPGAAAPGATFDETYRNAVRERIAAHRGTVGLAVVDIETGDAFAIRGNERFPSASVVKVPLMVEIFARVDSGRLALMEPLTLLAADKTGGSGILQYLSTPKEITVWDAMFLMITMSDNTATNLLLEKVRPRTVNERMRLLGLQQTELFVPAGGDPGDSFAPDSVRRYGMGATTPIEMATLLTRIYRRELISPDASRQMLGILATQFNAEGLPRSLPEGAQVFHKTGAMPGVRNDCGVVQKPGRPFAICVLTKDNADSQWSGANEADRLIADLARLTWDRIGGSD